jgi:uncharacterized membrane protein YbhN (UPF0104 family)
VGLLQYFVYCPIINAFAALPVTPGGLGLREGAFKFFFSSLNGVPETQAIALSLLFYGCNVLLSLFCGVLYLLGKPKELSLLKPISVGAKKAFIADVPKNDFV